jgi:hypothetical protein
MLCEQGLHPWKAVNESLYFVRRTLLAEEIEDNANRLLGGPAIDADFGDETAD